MLCSLLHFGYICCCCCCCFVFSFSTRQLCLPSYSLIDRFDAARERQSEQTAVLCQEQSSDPQRCVKLCLPACQPVCVICLSLYFEVFSSAARNSFDFLHSHNITTSLLHSILRCSARAAFPILNERKQRRSVFTFPILIGFSAFFWPYLLLFDPRFSSFIFGALTGVGVVY